MEKIKAFCSYAYWRIHGLKSMTIISVSLFIMIPYGISIGYWNVIKSISVFAPATDVYSELEKNDPRILLLLQNQPFKTIALGLFLLGILLLAIRFIFRPIAYVLSQRSLNEIQLAPMEKALANMYRIKKYDIDLHQEIKSGNLFAALEKQDSTIEKIKKLRKAHQPIFYYGIAHTPFIFRAGFSVGDESNNIIALHKAVDGTCFNKLSDGALLPKKIPTSDQNLDDHSSLLCKELIVLIETSFDISREDVESSFPENKNILTFRYSDTSELGRDSLNSFALQKLWCDTFWDTLRNICKVHDYNKVHLLISSSTDFTFYLAQHYSRTYDVDIIVYHYDRSNSIRYPWGIDIKKPIKEAVVYRRLI